MRKSINKLPLLLALLSVIFFSCQQEDNSLLDLQGTVRFGGISLEFEPMGSPGSRVMGNSPWIHVFPNSADLVFTNKVNGKEYVLEYNPNDFSVPYSITLPFGAYEYHLIVEGGIFSEFLPFEAMGEFILDSQSLEISLKAETDYGLVTVKDQYVDKASISDGNKESDLDLHQDSKYWFIYVKGGTAATLQIKESFQGSTIIRELNILSYKHYNFVLKLNEGSAVITDLILDPFDLEEEEIIVGDSSKFFEENGTIKCPEATPGEKGMVNDKIYETVDRALLITRRDEGADLSCVCTSLVTDMTRMFAGERDFNQNISSWDVSNVTDMSSMFSGAHVFNQPIGAWDVSNVTDMSSMFEDTDFNQPIGFWDVSNVTNMANMFEYSLFNQPIGSWDVSNVINMVSMFEAAQNFNQEIKNWNVSKVKNMGYMFAWETRFNQPIGDWDVSNVTNMGYMFSYSAFNQPIGVWDVKNVTNLEAMFMENSTFNQPIGDWDVSNVTNMGSMFEGATAFNQNLNGWCVQNIPSEPLWFSTPSALIEANKPIWGTCPD